MPEANIEEHSQLSRCVEYLMVYNQVGADGKKITKTAIAAHFGVSRQALYQWLLKWEQDGTMERALQIYLTPKMEEIQAATNELLSEWPKILRRMVKIARGDEIDGQRPFPRTSWEVAVWLDEKYVQPAREKMAAAGSNELAYAELEEQEFDVLDVIPSLPAGTVPDEELD